MSSQDKLNYYISQIDKELSKFPVLNQIEKQSQVPKAYSALAVLGLLALLIFFNVAAGFLTTALGWLLPAYFSMKALESPGPNDDKHWLTYWVTFGFLTTMEQIIKVDYWFPFYFSVKSIFILWLLLPQTRGAETVYQVALRPLVASGHKAVNSAAAPDVHAHAQ